MAKTTMRSPLEREREIFARWKAEIDFAQKDNAYTSWLERCEKIVKRYRDERSDQISKTKRQFNVLWSNVQTLLPAVYGKIPKPIVERRFMDRDPAARLASTILERTCAFQMEVGYYDAAVAKSVLDYLLPGMGQVWVRYEPEFESVEEAAENEEVERQEPQNEEDVREHGDGEPYEKLTYERVCVDYVFYRDFLWGPARCWREVPWVGRRAWMTHAEIAEKFYDGDMDEAKKISLDYTPERMRNSTTVDDRQISFTKKAEIWEIWNKPDRTVYFIAPSTPDIVLREEKDPVLKLEDFWPCPEPLFTTQTNDSLIPVPDYVEYQDQAFELDDLTNRISKLTEAVRANGVYDASYPALARLLQEGTDNKLLPIDDWAQFSEKHQGKGGGISLVPMQEVIEVLLRLYEARAQVKNDLFEITGMSDIVRGQSSGGQKTATEQRIKGQFASLRLQARQQRVADYCRSVLRIMAEIISEQFSPESLLQMSGVDQMMRDEVRKAVSKVKPPQAPQLPPDTPPEIAMLAQQQAKAQFQQMQQQAGNQAMQEQQEQFQEALRILRSDKLRGFRVDIETDSTLQADAEADKAAAIELFTATTQGIQALETTLPAAPELVEPLGDMLLFAYRRFRVGRSMESGLEDALTKVRERLEEAAANPQPSPEQIKAQAEIQKQQMESQRAQEEHQMDMQAKQADLELQKQKMQMELEKMQAELQIKREELELERQKLGMQAQAAAQQAAVKERQTQMQLQASEEQHALDREAADHQHELGMQTMEAKAQAAQQQAKAKPKEKA